VLSADWRFVYDGWNVVLVLDGLDGPDPDTLPDNTVTTKYTWGLDLSGTLHRGGGVGGLLASEETGTTGTPAYWFFYDGNGNVGQVLKASDQTIAAKYEYNPYGNQLASTGDYAAANPFRFSTKWLDTDLAGPNVKGAVGPDGMYYYGYRFYSPRLGRWINRDPIEEQGGLNLYGFVGNRPVDATDFVGLVVLGDCECENFIKYAGINNVTKTKVSPYRYLYEGGQVLFAGGFERQEIILKMLQSKNTFTLSPWSIPAGRPVRDQDYKSKMVANWALHIIARLHVVASARSSRFQFTTGDPKWSTWNPKYWTSQALTKNSSYDAIMDIWDPNTTYEYEIGCQNGSLLVFAHAWASFVGKEEFDRINPTGSFPVGAARSWLSRRHAPSVNDWNEWVPGDWGYLKAFNTSGRGLQGENLIYLGGGLFWGHGASSPIMTAQDWIDFWANISNPPTPPILLTRRDFPGEGLQ